MLLNCTIYNITCIFLKHSFITYHVNIVFRPMCRKTEIFIFSFLTIDLLIFWFLCASFCWKLSYPYQGKKLLINRCQSFFFQFLMSWENRQHISFIPVISRMRWMLFFCSCFSYDCTTKSIYILLLKILLLCNKT